MVVVLLLPMRQKALMFCQALGGMLVYLGLRTFTFCVSSLSVLLSLSQDTVVLTSKDILSSRTFSGSLRICREFSYNQDPDPMRPFGTGHWISKWQVTVKKLLYL